MNISPVCHELISLGKESFALEGSELMENYRKAALSLLLLKRLNRAHLLELDARKSYVETCRDKVGSAQLRLENLLYKQAYLLREIKICKGLETPQLKLVEDELQTRIAVDTYSPSLSEYHTESLLKLKEELHQRKAVLNTLIERQSTQKEQLEFLQKKRKALDDFPEKLKVLKTAVEGLASEFPSEQVSLSGSTLEQCRSLPVPLYILFRSVHILSNEDGLDGSMSGGPPSKHLSLVATLLGPGEGEGEEEAGGEWAVDITLRRDSLSSSASISPAEIATQGSGSAETTLRFRYRSASNTVHVSPLSITLTSSSNKALSLPFKKNKYLQALFPSELTSIGAVVSDAGPTDMGVPYLWAQWICGLRHLPSAPPPGPITAIPPAANYSVSAIISLLHSRLRSLWRLSNTLATLSSYEQAVSAPTPNRSSTPSLRPTFPLSRSLASYLSAVMSRSTSAMTAGLFGTVSLDVLRSVAMTPADVLVRALSLTDSHPDALTAERERVQELPVRPVGGLDEDGGSHSYGMSSRLCPVLQPLDQDSSASVYLRISVQLQIAQAATLAGGAGGAADCLLSIPMHILVDIPASYPVKPAQFMLAARRSLTPAGSGAYSGSSLRALEQELNAGCLSYLDAGLWEEALVGTGEMEVVGHSSPSPPNGPLSNSDLLEESLDGMLGLQLSLLFALLSTTATAIYNESVAAAEASEGTSAVVPSVSRGGRSRRYTTLSTFYGKSFSL